MSWASHPTSEMPAQPPLPTRRHRARRKRLIGAGAGVAALVLVTVVFLSGALGSSPDARTARALSSGGAPGAQSTVGAAGPGTINGGPPTGQATADATALEIEVLTLTNAERVRVGCPALRLDAKLEAAARAHSADMANSGVFGHPGADGSDPGVRMQRAGYDTSAGWAENIARGQPTPAAVLSAWMGSSDHRSNIVNCEFMALGVGVVRGGSGQLYWTQDFGGR